MAGFNVPTGGPVSQMTPELLAQLAAAGFKPPGQMPGMPVPMQQPTPGFNVGDGMAGLGAGVGMLANMGGVTNAGPQGSGPGGEYTPTDAMSMAGMGGDPNGASFGAPTGLGIPGERGGGPMDWVLRQLGLRDPLTGR